MWNAAFVLVQLILIHSDSSTLIFLISNSDEIINKWIVKNALMWWRLNLKSRYIFIRYFIKGDILYLYRYITERDVPLKFSWFIRKSTFIRNISETNHYKNWEKCGKKYMFLKIFAMFFFLKWSRDKSINILPIY